MVVIMRNALKCSFLFFILLHLTVFRRPSLVRFSKINDSGVTVFSIHIQSDVFMLVCCQSSSPSLCPLSVTLVQRTYSKHRCCCQIFYLSVQLQTAHCVPKLNTDMFLSFSRVLSLKILYCSYQPLC